MSFFCHNTIKLYESQAMPNKKMHCNVQELIQEKLCNSCKTKRKSPRSRPGRLYNAFYIGQRGYVSPMGTNYLCYDGGRIEAIVI